jgi:transposase
VGATKRGKGTKLMALADRNGFPIAIHTVSATPHEISLIKDTLAQPHIAAKPKRLIGDRAYDSNRLDPELAAEGIELIAPHRRNRSKAVTQDGRKLRRYLRRWTIERLFAWLQNFRRVLTRYEYRAVNYLGFVQLGCMRILRRNYF